MANPSRHVRFQNDFGIPIQPSALLVDDDSTTRSTTTTRPSLFCLWKKTTTIQSFYTMSSSKGVTKQLEPFVCGGSAATFASVVIHPIDLAKVRMQLYGQLNPGA
jgi:hypothetical protein